MSAPRLAVTIDTREQKPLIFPDLITLDGKQHRIITSEKQLDYADYCLHYPDFTAVAEVKRSMAELYKNLLTDDRARLLREFGRIKAAGSQCVLVLQMGLLDMVSPFRMRHESYPYEPVLDALWDFVTTHQVHTVITGRTKTKADQKRAGEMVVRVLYSIERAAANDRLREGINDLHNSLGRIRTDP